MQDVQSPSHPMADVTAGTNELAIALALFREPAFLAAGDGRVRACNAAADRLLQRKSLLELDVGSLRCVPAEHASRWTAALARCCRSPRDDSGDTTTDVHVLHLHAGSGPGARLFVFVMHWPS